MTIGDAGRFRNWARIAYIYFIIVALLGLLLRYVFIHPVLGVNFKYFLHAHSHTAFLGWIFNALYAAIVSEFVPVDRQLKRKYWVLFLLFQVSVVGMLITFPIKGYYRDSIIFSTLHIALSYLFAFYIFKDCKNKINRNNLALTTIKISLVFMIISSFGPFALGPLMVMEMSDSHWYNLAIYYYLHFQYNGWFVFALLGLFIKLLDNFKVDYDGKIMRLFIILLGIACVPAYALSTLWIPPSSYIFVIAFIAAILQLAAVGLLVQIMINAFPQLVLKMQRIAVGLILFSLFFFMLKNALQFLSAFEVLAQLAFQVRNFVIAYLHMVFIGFCSLFLLGWFKYKGWIALNTMLQKTGLLLFISSFLVSEALTVLYPTLIMLEIVLIPDYVFWIFIISTGLPLGLVFMVIAKIKLKKDLFHLNPY